MRKKLNGAQKIAVLVAVCGGETGARLLKTFEADEQAQIEQAMLEVDRLKLDDESLKAVLEEFQKLLQNGATA
ncbi:MAG TPA: hypothetical protein VEI02_13870, partial [Planctomycetota bacterium]|nr:hypothetical protein [Planctomycetota bacterium]